ncbi:hypothetical protein HK100_005227, partial [Physocladia obscura]
MTYIETPPTHLDQLKRKVRETVNNLPKATQEYLASLFPIANWLPRYNLQWFIGDLIAGITVGLVAIPQGISYATKLGNLPAQFGLYTAFLGALMYSFLATSKDVTIGATAVLTLVVGQTLATYAPAGSTPTELVIFSATLAFWTGVLELFIGLFRIGLLVDFVPVPVVAGFTSGAGIQIVIQQLPGLFGVKNVNTNNAPYQVLIDFFTQAIKGISIPDTIFGIVSLAAIFTIKIFAKLGSSRVPWLKYIGYLGHAIVLLIATGISYSFRNNSSVSFSMVKNIPYGLSGILEGNYSLPYAADVFRALPSVVLVAIMEHIAVVKTYGRLNGYAPDANQEIVALGLINIAGSFIGAIPATGSFSRSAIKSASGVRSPAASFITGVIVIISLFTITDALYFIPNATLAAIIINAISDLVNFRVVKPAFKIEILDFFGFWIAMWVTFVSSIEISLYTSVLYSVLVLLLRIARPQVKVLSRAPDGTWLDSDTAKYYIGKTLITSAPNGVLVFKIDESISYPNSAYFLSVLKKNVFENFSYTGRVISNSDRVWCDDSQERARKLERRKGKPLVPLRAVVFDMSAVNRVDFTGLQAFLDAKSDLSRFTGHSVPFYFAYVRPPQINTLLHVNRGDQSNYEGTPGVGLAETTSIRLNPFKRTKDPVFDGGATLNDLRYFHVSVDDAVCAALEETEPLKFTRVYALSPVEDYEIEVS